MIANPRKVLLKSIEPFAPAADSISKGNLLPVYCRADLSRTIRLVVALSLAAASTGVFAREFRAADTRNEEYPTMQALYGAAWSGNTAKAERDPAMAELIERMRKVE